MQIVMEFTTYQHVKKIAEEKLDFTNLEQVCDNKLTYGISFVDGITKEDNLKSKGCMDHL